MDASIGDIHHYDRRLRHALESFENDKTIPKANREVIIRYVRYRGAQGLSVPRQVRYLSTLRKLSRLLSGTFEEATKEDMIGAVDAIEHEKTSYATKETEKISIKCFFRWLRFGDEADDYPPEVKWIKSGGKINHRMLPDKLVTEEEVRKMAENANNPRDRALILVLYESGCRVGDLLPLTVGSVSFDKYGAILNVHGKTGGRRVRIIVSARALTEWLNHHPGVNNPDNPLWTSFDVAGSVRRLEYGAFRKMLGVVAERSAIKKRVNPHSFRHARASNVANVLTEAQMKEYFGWTGDSEMAATYVHLSGRNIDNALFKLNGIKTQEEVNGEEHPLAMGKCPRCEEMNPSLNRFCSRCGSPMDMQIAMDVEEKVKVTDDAMNRLFDDPVFRKFAEKRLDQIWR